MGVFKGNFERNPCQFMGFGITPGSPNWLSPNYVSLNLFSEVSIIILTLQGHFEDYVVK